MSGNALPQVRRLTRGALSALTGCNMETIRYYERIGLLPAPPRTEGGHRIYSNDHLKRLIFIRRSRQLGFTLDQVRNLLLLVDGSDYTCDEVKSLTLERMNDVRRKISDLRKLEKVLADMVSQCERGAVPDCPVIEALFRETA